jgi:hypothetical protein
MLKSIAIGITVVVTLFTGLILFAKVPEPTDSNTTKVTGVVTNFSSPCCNDLVVQLKGNKKRFYVNHGTELLSVRKLNEALRGREITLTQIDLKWHFWVGDLQPLSGISYGDSVVYSHHMWEAKRTEVN